MAREETLHELADEDLMQLVQRGEARAFEVLYDRHCSVAFSLAYRMCGSRAAAEDVVQEAFLAMWRSGARYDRTRGSVRTWALGIVHNRAIDSLRRSTVHDRRRVSDEARSVRDIIDELPKEQGRVIQLAYYGGFTHTEIAEMLETPIGTVKGRMRLGLEKMRARLQAAGMQGATP